MQWQFLESPLMSTVELPQNMKSEIAAELLEPNTALQDEKMNIMVAAYFDQCNVMK